MSKPRIFKVIGRDEWRCMGRDVLGAGKNPVDALRDWRRREQLGRVGVFPPLGHLSAVSNSAPEESQSFEGSWAIRDRAERRRRWQLTVAVLAATGLTAAALAVLPP